MQIVVSSWAMTAGPAVIAQDDTTICIPAGFAGTVDAHGNLHLEWQG